MTGAYRSCTQCIMDTMVPDIQFDERGVCNYCKQYEERIRSELHYDAAGQQRLQSLIAEIKRRGVHRDYDCLIGVSGGVDSTYVAYLVKKRFGLRPLAVHLDNGWDSEIGVSNVEQTVKRLDIDLYTYILDWEESKDLQVSFLKASIANAEIPTDHAIVATLFREAASRGIPYIITGSNIVTEAIMPASWMYPARDLRLIKAVHHQFGKVELKRYPQISILDFVRYTLIKGIKFFPILNYVPYVKKDAKQLLHDELGWRDYGGKHYESIYTRFFQSYILPRKFNIDKRKAHLSNLILSGQMTRDEALAEMEKPPCPSDQLEEDGEHVMKKLGLSHGEFAEMMAAPVKSFSDYPNNAFLWRKFAFVVKYARQRAIHNVRSS